MEIATSVVDTAKRGIGRGKTVLIVATDSGQDKMVNKRVRELMKKERKLWVLIINKEECHRKVSNLVFNNLSCRSGQEGEEEEAGEEALAEGHKEG